MASSPGSRPLASAARGPLWPDQSWPVYRERCAVCRHCVHVFRGLQCAERGRDQARPPPEHSGQPAAESAVLFRPGPVTEGNIQ